MVCGFHSRQNSYQCNYSKYNQHRVYSCQNHGKSTTKYHQTIQQWCQYLKTNTNRLGNNDYKTKSAVVQPVGKLMFKLRCLHSRQKINQKQSSTQFNEKCRLKYVHPQHVLKVTSTKHGWKY